MIKKCTQKRRPGLFLGSMVVLVFFSGCAMFARGPMEVLTYEEDANQDKARRQMFVFMRGMGGSHRSFEEEGLVADVRSRNLSIDMAAPNSHFGYYLDRSLIERLKTDVIDPARSKGYDRIWLIGFSLGGLGSLLYQMERPEDITGVCLISPFLGNGSILDEIAAAGGVRNWDPGSYKAEEDWERMLWHWLKTGVADRPEKKVFLGYGSYDRYVQGQRLLADILPEGHVSKVPGRHNYDTFKTLWHLFLEGGQYTVVPNSVSANDPDFRASMDPGMEDSVLPSAGGNSSAAVILQSTTGRLKD